MSKGVHVRIEHPEVWDAFRIFVMKLHGGKAHTVMGQELEKALLNHMESYSCQLAGDNRNQSTRTHVYEEEQKPAPKKKKDIPMSPYHERLTAIQDRMREVGAWDVESFQDGIAVRYIKELCGGDSRTINKYYSDLQMKWSIEH